MLPGTVQLPWARRAHSGDPLDTKYAPLAHKLTQL